ncbi:DUF4837 family protein [Flammeovirgaceae bacterium SG7u.111]|nr:DUF4837 family protein [Flammeovirgaceae bacterium SG7u.132]WPO37378.1 DUF4837 family protein [Flammeovirgaceae bacterium SG7u.111]
MISTLKQTISQLLFLSVFLLILGSCNKKQKKAAGLLPSAKGDKGEIILVMDTARWNGPLGDELRKIFLSRVPGLPQPEPMFTVRAIDPFKFSSFLTQHKNLLFVTSLEDNTPGNRKMIKKFSPEALERIKIDTSLYMQTSTDEYAKGQFVVNLFGIDDATLLQKLKNNAEKIRETFNKVERERLISDIRKTKMNNKLMEIVKTKHNFSMRIPQGYKLAKDTTNFIWLRFTEYEFDKNILISYKPYRSTEEFQHENIVQLRNDIMQKQTQDPDNAAYFVVTEELIPPVFKETSINGNYAIEARGLWKLKHRFMGGPFLSYTFVDKAGERLFYIEGFVSAPGTTKREHIRELEVLLRTFQTF